MTTNHGYESAGGFAALSRQIQEVGDFSYTKVNDPRLVALYERAKDSLDMEEIKSIIRQTDEIYIREYFGLAKSPHSAVYREPTVGHRL